MNLAAAALALLAAGPAALAQSEAAVTPATTLGVFLGASGPGGRPDAELRNGAELAVADCGPGAAACTWKVAANAGQWSAGAGELVRLVYTDHIRAVLGPADGRTAHLAEQVAARGKGRFLLLTPWVSDPTLTQIRLPWFFRLVPDDRRQAERLLREVHARGVSRPVLAVVEESDYDSRVAADALDQTARRLTLPGPRRIPLAADTAALIGTLQSQGADAVIVIAPPDAAATMVRELRERGVTASLLGFLHLACAAFLDGAGAAAEGMLLAAPPDPSGAEADEFRRRYRSAYAAEPGIPAAFGYDGASVLLEALRTAGADGEDAIRARLAATRRTGLTGLITFDPTGTRVGAAPLAIVDHGRLRAVSGGTAKSLRSVTQYATTR